MTFHLDLGLHEALGLWLSLAEGDGRTEGLRGRLRDFLYEGLSIAEMEDPERTYRLGSRGLEGRGKGQVD